MTNYGYLKTDNYIRRIPLNSYFPNTSVNLYFSHVGKNYICGLEPLTDNEFKIGTIEIPWRLNLNIQIFFPKRITCEKTINLWKPKFIWWKYTNLIHKYKYNVVLL